MNSGKIIKYVGIYGGMFLAFGGAKAGCQMVRSRHIEPPAIASTESGLQSMTENQQLRYIEVRHEIERLNRFVINNRDLNQKRIQVSKLYVELANLDHANRLRHLRQAAGEIETAELATDGQFQYHSDRMFVRDYFEVLLQKGVVYAAARELNKAEKTYQRVIRESNDPFLRVAQQVHDYSIPGYQNRARLELAQVYFAQEQLPLAKPLLDQVIAWSNDETKVSFAIQFYRDEKLKDLRFLAAKSLSLRARIKISDRDNTGALQDIRTILSYKESGSKEGFMDLGFEAILLAMHVCLRETSEINEAKKMFRDSLPWDKLNEQKDIKLTLGLADDFDFTSSDHDLWVDFMTYLKNAELPPHLGALYDQMKF